MKKFEYTRSFVLHYKDVSTTYDSRVYANSQSTHN